MKWGSGAYSPTLMRSAASTAFIKKRILNCSASCWLSTVWAIKSGQFLMASGKLQALCYKNEIEKALRTPGLAGFQLLGLQDFPGQGTALVGMLNALWQNKPYVTPKEISRFCNSVVPLVRMPQFVYRRKAKSCW